MGSVYRVGSIDIEEYFNTAREAGRFKPYDEEPESFVKVDAAAECNRLSRMVDETERRLVSVRLMLEELLGVCCPDTVDGTDIGRRVQRYLADNPLPLAGSADRDGGRSYGV